MAKYTNLFLEEASEHLAEMSRALLALEKDASSADSIDLAFRMAHSIKSMAASLGFDSISDLSHRLEDRMQRVRGEGRISAPEDLVLLFRGLESLERMVEHVREHGLPARGTLEHLGNREPVRRAIDPGLASALFGAAEYGHHARLLPCSSLVYPVNRLAGGRPLRRAAPRD